VTPAAAKTAIFDQMTQQHIDFMLSKIPKGRFVLVEELAAMVAWLASEDCAFSTGAVFDISGGRATYARLRHAAVPGAQRHRGGRRAGHLRRPQRLCADRAHLGVGKDGLGGSTTACRNIRRRLPLRCGTRWHFGSPMYRSVEPVRANSD
jgi:hypothetical protein